MAAFNNNVYYCFVIAEFVFVHQADTLIPVLIRIAFIEIDNYFYLSDVIHVGKAADVAQILSIQYILQLESKTESLSKTLTYLLNTYHESRNLLQATEGSMRFEQVAFCSGPWGDEKASESFECGWRQLEDVEKVCLREWMRGFPTFPLLWIILNQVQQGRASQLNG